MDISHSIATHRDDLSVAQNGVSDIQPLRGGMLKVLFFGSIE